MKPGSKYYVHGWSHLRKMVSYLEYNQPYDVNCIQHKMWNYQDFAKSKTP